MRNKLREKKSGGRRAFPGPTGTEVDVRGTLITHCWAQAPGALLSPSPPHLHQRVPFSRLFLSEMEKGGWGGVFGEAGRGRPGIWVEVTQRPKTQ